MNARRLVHLLQALSLTLAILFASGTPLVLAQDDDTMMDPGNITKSDRSLMDDTADLESILGIDMPVVEDLAIVPDQYLAEDLGLSLVDDDGALVMRIGWLHEAQDMTVGDEADKVVGNFPEFNLSRRSIEVGGYYGEVIEGVPGQTETTVVILDVDDRLFKMTFSGAQFDQKALELLEATTFRSPTLAIEELNIPALEDTVQMTVPEAMQREAELGSLNRTQTAREQEVYMSTAPARPIEPQRNETVHSGGCTTVPDWLWMQTIITYRANGHGYTFAGPNFYDEGLHKNCSESRRLNDYFAIDYPVRLWDAVLPPTGRWWNQRARVIYAGWASEGWSSLGRVIILDLGGGVIWSAAHLGSISVSPGQWVGFNDVIGYAGGSGYHRNNY